MRELHEGISEILISLRSKAEVANTVKDDLKALVVILCNLPFMFSKCEKYVIELYPKEAIELAGQVASHIGVELSLGQDSKRDHLVVDDQLFFVFEAFVGSYEDWEIKIVRLQCLRIIGLVTAVFWESNS